MQYYSLGNKPGVNPSLYSQSLSLLGKALTDSVYRLLVSTQVDWLLARHNIQPAQSNGTGALLSSSIRAAVPFESFLTIALVALYLILIYSL